MTVEGGVSAVVLRLVDYGERHRVVTLFTAEHGRFAAMARNARGSARRFGGHLDLFHLGRAGLSRPRRAGAMAVLDTYVLERGFPGIREDVVRFAAASFFVELVLTTTAEGDGSPPQFGVLVQALGRLDERGEVRDQVLGFQLQWFDALGLLPPLDDLALVQAGLPRLSGRPLAVARALLSGAAISDLDDDVFREVGALTRAVRGRSATRPPASLAFLHQVLDGRPPRGPRPVPG